MPRRIGRNRLIGRIQQIPWRFHHQALRMPGYEPSGQVNRLPRPWSRDIHIARLSLTGFRNHDETALELGTGLRRELELVTLLPFDAIRSIEDPVFVDRTRADELYSPDELVLGIDIEGDVRAYSVPLLSRHEVVNDVVGGKPVAITW